MKKIIVSLAIIFAFSSVQMHAGCSTKKFLHTAKNLTLPAAKIILGLCAYIPLYIASENGSIKQYFRNMKNFFIDDRSAQSVAMGIGTGVAPFFTGTYFLADGLRDYYLLFNKGCTKCVAKKKKSKRFVW